LDFLGAQTQFKTFINRYSQSPLTPNAYYWLGESFFEMEDYENAMAAFYNGYHLFSHSSKASENLFRYGVMLDYMGQPQEACNIFSEVEDKFNRDDQKLKRAKQRAGCF
jgi:tol-pal system protein YbgF